MEPIDTRWDDLTETEWNAFAEGWLEELRAPAQVSADDTESDDSGMGQSVVMMNLTARPELQWQFVLRAVALADSDDALGHIAAGPLEHLLGWHGEAFIAEVERRAAIDPRFSRTLTGVWRNKISDSVWGRVQALQAQVPDPLRSLGDT